MEEISEKNKIISGLIWKVLERGGTLGIQFIIQIILARLLLPEEYGLIALGIVFIQLGDVFVQTGFSTSLIQKKHADDLDFSSVFYSSIVISIILYIVIFSISPYIGQFYNEPNLTIVLRILGITLLFGAINSVQIAYISRSMKFKKLFKGSFGSVIVSGVVGVTIAYLGYGIWALVAQQLINKISLTIILWLTVRWRPKLVYSITRVKELFSYGWKILASGLLETLYVNIYGLVIGRIYDSRLLGLYSKGDQFPKYTVTIINGSISAVLFPALSNNQDNIIKFKNMVRKSVVISSFIVLPVMIGLATIAEPFILIVLTEKWLPAVPFMQLLCISYAFWPLHTANLQAIKALGKSDTYLRLEIIKKIIGFTVLIISVPFGIYVMVALIPITSIILTLINAYPNKKMIGYSYKEQWSDITPSLLISMIMAAIIYPIKHINISSIYVLIIQTVLGVLLYTMMSYKFNSLTYNYLILTIKELLNKKSA